MHMQMKRGENQFFLLKTKVQNPLFAKSSSFAICLTSQLYLLSLSASFMLHSRLLWWSQ